MDETQRELRIKLLCCKDLIEWRLSIVSARAEMQLKELIKAEIELRENMGLEDLSETSSLGLRNNGRGEGNAICK